MTNPPILAVDARDSVTIVHLSDLHFLDVQADLASGNPLPPGGIWAEAWRPARVNDLVNNLTRGGKLQPDYLFFTGDLIVKGRREDIAGGIAVLRAIVGALRLAPDRVFTALGNHDFGGATNLGATDSRAEILTQLTTEGWHLPPANTEPFWRLHSMDGSNLALILESRKWFPRSGATAPPEIRSVNSAEMHELLREIKLQMATMTDQVCLHILSHDVPSFLDDSNHMVTPTDASRTWPGGGSILEEIIRHTGCAKAIWYCGDAHCQSRPYEMGLGKGTVYVAGAMNLLASHFNITHDKNGHEIHAMTVPEKWWPSARTITTQVGATLGVYDYVARCKGEFALFAAQCRWELKVVQEVDAFATGSMPPVPTPKLGAPTETASLAAPDLQLIGAGYDDTILQVIRDLGLYDIALQQTHSGEETLNWIPVHELLVTGGCFYPFTTLARTWLMQQLEADKAELARTLVIGIDVWGAMLAAQIGTMLGTGATSVYSQNHRQWADRMEGLERSQSAIEGAQHIGVVIDVVATGKTLQKIVTQLREWNPTAKVYVVCVILNSLLTGPAKKLPDGIGLPEGVRLGAGCSKIPLLSAATLGVGSLQDFLR